MKKLIALLLLVPVFAQSETSTDIELTAFLAAGDACGQETTVGEGGCLAKLVKKAETAMNERIEIIFDRAETLRGEDSSIVSTADWRRQCDA